MLLPPRIITFDRPIWVGRERDTPRKYVYEGKRDVLLVSENHHRLPSGRWDGGGPFYQYSEKLTHGPVKVFTNRLNGQYDTYRIVSVAPGPDRLTAPQPPPWLGLDGVKRAVEAFHAKAWNQTRPGNPLASVGQFIAELRDLPQVPFKRALRGGAAFKSIPRIALKELTDFRNLGSEYLNVVFGWKPFVNDLRKMYNLWHTIDKKLAQIIRDNGRGVRRKAVVLNSPGIQVVGEPFVHLGPYYQCRGAPAYPPYGSGKTVWTLTKATKEKVWCAGSFRYYIPDTSSSQWTTRARLALFGALPTPELLWELLPWSWLVDWFSNVGDVISNASMNAVDNLTSDYFFVMRKYEEVTKWEAYVSHGSKFDPFWKDEWPSVDFTFNTVKHTRIQSRSGGGSPYGLDIRFDSLSNYQLGILAALGISRSKFL